MNDGLEVSRTAPEAPTSGPPTRSPIRYVAHTASPARSGTTRNIALGPATSVNAAIAMGKPGE